MGLIETAKRYFCLEKWMILVSVDGFFQFLPKLVEEKVSSRMEKTSKNHGKNHPLEETANPGPSSGYPGFRSHPTGSSASERPLQQHFYALGLLDWFTPLHGSDQPICLGGPIFSNLMNPYLTFPGGFHIWVIPRCRVPGPVQTASSISMVWNSSSNFGLSPWGYSVSAAI